LHHKRGCQFSIQALWLTTAHRSRFPIVVTNYPVLFTNIKAEYNGESNTPADDTWTLILSYTLMSSINPIAIPIVFLPDGQVQNTTTVESDYLTQANLLLAPTVEYLRNITGDPLFDIWQLLNWLVVCNYWIFLYDLGQIAPVYYNISKLSGVPNIAIPPILYEPTNNIFVNGTLFSTYYNYLNDTVVPLIRLYSFAFLLLPLVTPVNETNGLQASPTAFVRTYSCLAQQLKPAISLVILLIIADYTFLTGAYHLLLWFLELREIYKNPNGIDCRCPIWLTFSEFMRRVFGAKGRGRPGGNAIARFSEFL
jgi:hypothetical protein